MGRGRRQFTLRWLMGLVAIAGLETALYAGVAKGNVIMYKDNSMALILKGMVMANLAYGLLWGLIRSAVVDRMPMGTTGHQMKGGDDGR